MMYFVPALLQTEEYAWETIEDIEPNMNADIYRQWGRGRDVLQTIASTGQPTTVSNRA